MLKENLNALINAEHKLQNTLAKQIGFLARDPSNANLISDFKKDVIASKERTMRYQKMLENE